MRRPLEGITRAHRSIDIGVLDGPLRLSARDEHSGAQNDYLQLRDTQCHLVTGGFAEQAIATFPGGAASVLLRFNALDGDGDGDEGLRCSTSEFDALAVEHVDPALAQPGGQHVGFRVNTNRGSLVITGVLGSVREVRDVTEGPGHPPPRAPGHEPTTVSITESADGPTAVFRRVNLGGGVYSASLAFPPGTKLTIDPEASTDVAPGLVATRSDERPLTFDVVAVVPDRPLTPFERLDELIRPEKIADLKRLLSRGGAGAAVYLDSLARLKFLSYREGLLAGSFRFPTHFGRDVIQTVLMLQDVLRPEVTLAALGTVLDRVLLDPDPALAIGLPSLDDEQRGRVAHEPIQGVFAEAFHLHRAQRLREAGEAVAEVEVEVERALALAREQIPIHDYKMVDGEALLVLFLDAFARLEGLSPEAKHAFLDGRRPDGHTRREAAVAALSFLARRARDYEQDPTPGGLVSFERTGVGERGQPLFLPVGDARDSAEGNAGKPLSGNINAHLMPAALDAAPRVASLLSGGEKIVRAEVRGDAPDPEELRRLADLWREVPDQHFKVHLDVQTLRERIARFLKSADESSAFLAWVGTQPLGPSGPTVREFAEGAEPPPTLATGLTFTALARGAGPGDVAEVMNSDGSLALFFADDLTRGQVEEIVRLMELPYPLGLLVPAGLLSTNPVTAGDVIVQVMDERGEVTHRDTVTALFNRKGYWATNVWVHTQEQMMLGLCKTIRRLKDSALPEDQALVERMFGCLDRLLLADQRAGPLLNAEIRGVGDDGRSVRFGAEPGAQVHSNDAQLWATANIAVLLEVTALYRECGRPFPESIWC